MYSEFRYNPLIFTVTWKFYITLYFDFSIFRIAQKREDAVTREMTKKFSDDKKMTRKERDER